MRTKDDHDNEMNMANKFGTGADDKDGDKNNLRFSVIAASMLSTLSSTCKIFSTLPACMTSVKKEGGTIAVRAFFSASRGF